MLNIPNLSVVKEIAVDTETRDPNLKEKGAGWATHDGELLGYSLAIEGWQDYFSWGHEGGGNIDKEAGLRLLKDVAALKCLRIFANYTYDAGWAGTEGVKFTGPIADIQVAAPLIDEYRYSYSLDSLALALLSKHKNEAGLLAWAAANGIKDPKHVMHKIPHAVVREYAADDTGLTLGVWSKQKPVLDLEDLWKIFNLEMELQPMFLEMRRRGVRVDLDEAERVKKIFNDIYATARAEAKARFDWEGSEWSAGSIGKKADEYGIKYPRTPIKQTAKGPKGGAPSFERKWLEDHNHPFMQLVARIRKFGRAAGTFIDSQIYGHVHNGRIHAEIHALPSDDGGTVTGRLSYSHPNLQQVPARDQEMATYIRGIYLPEAGTRWLRDDYSQQEPRLTVHYAALLKLRGAAEAVEYYKDPKADYHSMVAEMAGIERTPAKTINLGLAYGMGVKKLCDSLGLSLADGKDLLELYHSRVPFVRLLGRKTSAKSGSKGFITTLGGRRCRFPLWEPVDDDLRKEHRPTETPPKEWGAVRRAFTHKSMNRLIQGSAADMTKKAMRDLWKEGIVSMIQVHDELNNSIENSAQQKKIEEIMRTCVSLKVPVRVDGKVGNNWAEATAK